MVGVVDVSTFTLHPKCPALPHLSDHAVAHILGLCDLLSKTRLQMLRYSERVYVYIHIYEHIHLSIDPSLHLSIYLYIYLYVYLSNNISIYVYLLSGAVEAQREVRGTHPPEPLHIDPHVPHASPLVEDLKFGI